jgi:hypothetical protein
MQRGHVQVDTIPNNSPLTFNFTALPAQSSINATTMFRVQACSGTVFVNQVGPLCVCGCVWVRGVRGLVCEQACPTTARPVIVKFGKRLHCGVAGFRVWAISLGAGATFCARTLLPLCTHSPTPSPSSRMA